MSLAFDLVSHGILLRKLLYYGIIGKELSLFKSLLEDRSSFVELETFMSDPIMNDPCSVLQGSKLSGILFIIYINEVPDVHLLLEDDNITNIMTGEKKKTKGKIDHNMINFVDYSWSIVSFEREDYAIEYVEMLSNSFKSITT